MRVVLFFLLSTSLLIRAEAQLPNSVSIVGLQRPVITSVTATTGGSLSGTYYYLVLGVDTLGGQSGYARGYPISVGSPNSAAVINWNISPYAKTYKIYRSVGGLGPWYLLVNTSSLTYTDIGYTGTLSNPSVATTAVLGIKGTTGVDIKDEAGWNVIKSINIPGGYANSPGVQLGSFQFGSTNTYGGNGGLVKSYQGIWFEPQDSVYTSSYYFRGRLDNNAAVRLDQQKVSLIDGDGNERTKFDQNVADGSSAVAFKLVSYNALANSNAKLFSIVNQYAECFSIMASGNVRAKKITVTQTGWSDYVFKPGYSLRSIEAVASFINKNGRLPDVPDAKQVEKQGMDVGDSQALLLRKIEELTLYVIDLKKQMTKQGEEISQMRSKKSLLKLK